MIRKNVKLINKIFSLWNRIKFKLLLFGILMSIVPIMIYGWYNIQITKLTLEENIQERQLYIAERAVFEVNELLTSILSRMELLIGANDRFDDRPEAKEKWEQSLYSFLKQNSEIENAYVFDKNGIVIAYASRWEVKGLIELTDLQYKKIENQIKLGHQSIVGEVQYNESGSPYVNMVVPFYSTSQQMFGGMIVEVNLRSTFKKVASILSGKEGYIYIIDGTSKLIAHTDFSQVLMEKDVIKSAELKQMIINQTVFNKPSRYTSYTGKEVIGIYQPITLTNWGVIIEQPVDQAYYSMNLLVKRLIMTMLIVMILVVLTSVIFGIRFTRPIELMEKAVQRVRKGRLDTKIDYETNDEFGSLAAAFNHMTKELKMKSEHLEQEKERLATIINGSGAGFALVYDNFKIAWLNQRLKDWLKAEQTGMSCYNLLGRFDQPCKDCPITLKNIEHCQNEIVNIIDENNKKRIFRHRMYPLEHTQIGEPQYLIVVEDITNQKQLEEMVIQADKLSALGILASGFAHEVNNPLASISVYAEDLKERLEEESPDELMANGEIDHYLDTIRNNVERCKRITNSLLNYSRKSNFVNKELNIAKAIDDSLVLLEHVLKKKQIVLIKKLNYDMPKIVGDDLQFQQVFINLIKNALDAIEDRGTLEIETELEQERINVYIRDNGNGMTEEQIHRVFDPFYTTKPVGKGTGLGIYIAYNIMKKYNGDIIITSQKNVGTKVKVIFPYGKLN